ncbi:MAG: class C sortase [Eubacteriales bacterium]|nr:class C sortase [Eubacteriales bacterium]
MKGKILNIVVGIFFLLGLGLLLYPTVSNWWNKNHTSRAISVYNDQLAEIDVSEAEAEIAKARAYNDRLNQEADKAKFMETHRQEYESLLNLKNSGIMGYVDIPTIQVTLPIYHGTEENVLQVAAGHLEWTSLPVGGENTHTVISGHRGLPSAKLFTDLDAMQVGDVFTVHIYHEEYYYQVDDISVILPEETTILVPRAGNDYCTLLTCTPYGINSHRLLVRGTRIYPTFQEVTINDDLQVISPIVVSGAAAAVILLLGCILDWSLAGRPGRRKKEK